MQVQRRYNYPVTVELYVLECCSCGLVFGMPSDYDDRRRVDGRSFHCPNGHSQSYTKSKLDREREKREHVEASLARERAAHDQTRAARDAAERRARAYRGHLTRMRNRIANGVCPVPGCRRSGFDKVKSHIASVHPQWWAEHEELHA